MLRAMEWAFAIGVSVLGLVILGLLLDAVFTYTRWWNAAYRIYWLAVFIVVVFSTGLGVVLLIRNIVRGEEGPWAIVLGIPVQALVCYWLISGAWVRSKSPPAARYRPVRLSRGDPRSN